jgi:hypothetical protein
MSIGICVDWGNNKNVNTHTKTLAQNTTKRHKPIHTNSPESSIELSVSIRMSRCFVLFAGVLIVVKAERSITCTHLEDDDDDR